MVKLLPKINFTLIQKALIIYSTTPGIARKLIQFVYGLLVGLIFYYSIIRFIGFSGKYRGIALSVTCLSSAFLCLCSIQFRCISCLLWLSALGNAGRNLIKTIIIALVLSGPINNIVENTKEVTRISECTAYLTYKLTKTRIELAIMPFMNAFQQTRGNLSTIQGSFNNIQQVIFPIVNEIEGKINTNRSKLQIAKSVKSSTEYKDQYAMKLKSKCEMQFQKGTEKCKQSFEEVYNDCLNKANTLICSPLKVNFICNLNEVATNLVVDVCNPSNVIDENFGDEYAQMKENEMNFVLEYSNISFDIDAANPIEIQSIKTLNETGRKLSSKLNEKASLMNYIFRVCDKLMLLIYMKIIYDGIRYHDNYLSRINFNNYYITDYFEKIDKRRQREGLKIVLPIRKIELDKIVDLHGRQKIHREFQGYIVLTLRQILNIIAASFFIALDRLFFELLDIIKKHSRIEFDQEGYHYMNITVEGAGFVASLIRNTMDGFNINKTVDYEISNEMCLPEPTLTKTITIVQIYMLFMLNFYLIYNQVHIHRSKRLICAYFYPKREKVRILHLYNKMLRERTKIFSMIVQIAKNRVKSKDQHGWFKKLVRKCTFFKIFPFARCKCIICRATQPKKMIKDHKTFWICKKRKCDSIFCHQCWADAGNKCIICWIKETDDNKQ